MGVHLNTKEYRRSTLVANSSFVKAIYSGLSPPKSRVALATADEGGELYTKL